MRAVMTFLCTLCGLCPAWNAAAENDASLEVVVALSSSVPESVIEGYGREARRFGARLVMRGIPIDPALLKERYFGCAPKERARQKERVLEGWMRLAALAKRTGAPLEVDPEFFRTHRIEAVPRIFIFEKSTGCSACAAKNAEAAKPRILYATPPGAVPIAWVLKEAFSQTGAHSLRSLLERGGEP